MNTCWEARATAGPQGKLSPGAGLSDCQQNLARLFSVRLCGCRPPFLSLQTAFHRWQRGNHTAPWVHSSLVLSLFLNQVLSLSLNLKVQRVKGRQFYSLPFILCAFKFKNSKRGIWSTALCHTKDQAIIIRVLQSYPSLRLGQDDTPEPTKWGQWGRLVWENSHAQGNHKVRERRGIIPRRTGVLFLEEGQTAEVSLTERIMFQICWIWSTPPPKKVKVKVAQLCPTLWDPMSIVHGIL